MAPFYEEICLDLGWIVDQTLLENMKLSNKTELKKLEKAIEDAETNLGETEVRDALLTKAEHLCKIGDKVCKKLPTNRFHLPLHICSTITQHPATLAHCGPLMSSLSNRLRHKKNTCGSGFISRKN
jgi:hypothetical protein